MHAKPVWIQFKARTRLCSELYSSVSDAIAIKNFC
ncbi:hypothetical protein Gotur_017721 [Gossypium turneri]